MVISSDGTAPGGQHYRCEGAQTLLPPPPPLPGEGGIAVFLDFDGTLVEIALNPDDVIVPPRLPALIAALSNALDGRLAIVTGRSISALEGLLGSIGVAVAGSHGGEFRPSATEKIVPLAEPIPAAVVNSLSDFARTNGGLLVEPKPFSVAVHYRHHTAVFDDLLACGQKLAAQFGLALKQGKFVLELVMPGSDKGSAVRRFMQLPAFAGSTPLFLGDDVTDEDAFRAVRDLGGAGVLIGELRETLASFRIADVPATHAWLEAGLEAVREAQAA